MNEIDNKEPKVSTSDRMKGEERPLVTFALFAYNQEKYVREAIEGACSQTYEPLEIILSDDCSTDKTFELMRRMAASYSGPHSIRINRNAKNLGIAEHLNVVLGLVRSQFVVLAAGDDISKRDRTVQCFNAWENNARKPLLIHSLAQEIDESGENTSRLRRGLDDAILNDVRAHTVANIGVLGATEAADLRLITEFPPLSRSLMNEDVIFPARAALVGRVQFINAPLVQYRVSVGVSHEMSRLRKEANFTTPWHLRMQNYCLFVQKYRDYRALGQLSPEFRSNLRIERARSLLPMALIKSRVTRRRAWFFLRRGGFRNVVSEVLRWRFHNALVLKRRIQYLHLPKLKNPFSKK